MAAWAPSTVRRHELIFVYKVGTAKHLNTFGLGETGRYRTNVWDYAGVNSFGGNQEDLALHPTVKPVALVADAIRDVTRRGDIVLDGFGGSGTTLIAAERTGRVARLIELDPLYCDVICRRYEALTGQPARLEGTDQSFADVAVERGPRGQASDRGGRRMTDEENKAPGIGLHEPARTHAVQEG